MTTERQTRASSECSHAHTYTPTTTPLFSSYLCLCLCRRGNPLHLCSERYRKIERLWRQHGIAEVIGHAQEANQTLVTIDWQHLWCLTPPLKHLRLDQGFLLHSDFCPLANQSEVVTPAPPPQWWKSTGEKSWIWHSGILLIQAPPTCCYSGGDDRFPFGM